MLHEDAFAAIHCNATWDMEPGDTQSVGIVWYGMVYGIV